MKKHLKLLILLLSVALIVGALAVVAGASDAEQPDKVALYQGDALQTSDLSFDSAIAAIQANTTASDSYTIKLLGNNYVWSDSVFGAEFTAATTVNIDLNGWELNCGMVTTALTATNANVTVNVIGSGSIVFGSALAVATDGATININGTGYGIEVKSSSAVTNIVTANGSNSNVSIKNVNLSVSYEVEVGTSVDAVEGNLINVEEGAHAVLENVDFDYACKFVALPLEEGATLANAGAHQLYAARVAGDAQLVIKNSYIKTTGSGIKFSVTAGADYEGLEGKYACVMENSSLVCADTHSTDYIKQYCHSLVGNDGKPAPALKANATRTYLFCFEGKSGLCAGDILIKNSYTGATYRLMAGQAGMNAATDPAHVIYDNSTLEGITSVADLAGFPTVNNGEGILDGGATFVTFKNNSTLKLHNNAVACAGSSNNNLGEALYKDTEGNFTVNLEAGTRYNFKSIAKAGIPVGYAFVLDLSGANYQAPYKLVATEGAVADKIATSAVGAARADTFDKTENLYFAGMSGVTRYTAQTVEQIKNSFTPESDGRYSHKADNNNTHYVTIAEDEKSYTLTTTAYFTPASVMIKGSEYKVSVHTFYMYVEAENPVRFDKSNFKLHGKSSTHVWGPFSNYESNIVAGEWNQMVVVTDYTSGVSYSYINGVLNNTTKNEGVAYMDQFRLNVASGTYVPGQSVYFAKSEAHGYKEYLGGSFNAADYVPNDEPLYAKGDIMVGNQSFANVNDALAYAKTVGGFVNLYCDSTDNAITNEGAVRTNGYNFTYNTAIIAEEGANGVSFYKGVTNNISWYTGTAEDPAADSENMTALEFAEGAALYLPEGVKVNSMFLKGSAFKPVGWATTYVSPVGKSADEYNEAISGLTVVTDFTTVTANGDVTYYPVYEVVAADYIAITKDGEETIYSMETNLNVAMALVGPNGTIKLNNDVTVAGIYNSKAMGSTDSDNFFRSNRTIDVNGYTLTVDNSNNNYWVNMASGTFTWKSSAPGGKIVQCTPVAGNAAMVNVRSNDVRFKIVDPNGYLTVEAYRLADVTQWGKNGSGVYESRTPQMQIEGGIIINRNTVDVHGCLTSDAWANMASYVINGTTFINAGSGALFNVRAAIPDKGYNSVEMTNCNVINLTNAPFAYDIGENVTFNITDSYIGCELDNIDGTINLKGNVVIADADARAVIGCEDGKVLAYNHSVTVSMPAVLGESYEVAGVGTVTAETLVANFKVVDATETTLYTWTFDGNSVFAAYVVNGEDASGLNGKAASLCSKALNVITLTTDGNWTLDGTNFTCGYAVKGIKSGLGKVTVTMHEGFGVKFYIEAATYAYLDAESQAKFTAVTKDEMELYVMVVGDVDVNEAFTNLTFSVKFTEAEYEYVANYRVNLADYIGASLTWLPDEDNSKAMAYYIAAYLNNAYAYFTENDADEEKLAALAAMVENNKDLYNAEAVARPTVGEAINAGGAIDIAVDLTSTPAFVIKSTIGGTVNFNGKDYTIVAGEELVINASVLDFDNVLTFALEGDVTGTYCLGNYAANIAAAESIEGLDEAGLASLKALVAAFYDYVIYAENFR